MRNKLIAFLFLMSLPTLLATSTKAVTAEESTLNNYIYEDDIVFDFIPFSFNGKREKFFINDNSTIDNLIKSNNTYKSLVENSDMSSRAFFFQKRKLK